MIGDARQTIKNVNSPTRENVGEFLAVFRGKYVNLQSIAMPKHKFQKIVLNPPNEKSVRFS